MHYFFENLYTEEYINGMPMAYHITVILDIKCQITDAGGKKQ
jgi:hypothetical protein